MHSKRCSHIFVRFVIRFGSLLSAMPRKRNISPMPRPRLPRLSTRCTISLTLPGFLIGFQPHQPFCIAPPTSRIPPSPSEFLLHPLHLPLFHSVPLHLFSVPPSPLASRPHTQQLPLLRLIRFHPPLHFALLTHRVTLTSS